MKLPSGWSFQTETASPKNIRAYLHEYGYKLPALRDAEHAWVEKSRVKVTPEAAVFNTKRELVYHGRIDNLYQDFGKARRAATTHELADAIEAASKGVSPADRVGGRDWMFHRGPEMKRPAQAVGTVCLVLRVDGWRLLAQQLSAAAANARRCGGSNDHLQSRTSRPFFFQYCANCHRPGEAGPFPLLTYKDAKAHAKQMAAVTQSRFMAALAAGTRRVQVCK